MKYQPDIKSDAKIAYKIFEENNLPGLLDHATGIIGNMKNDQGPLRSLHINAKYLSEIAAQINAAVQACTTLRTIAEYGLDKNELHANRDIVPLLNLTRSKEGEHSPLPVTQSEGGNVFRSITNFAKDHEKELLALYQEQLQDEIDRIRSESGGGKHRAIEDVKRIYAERVINYHDRLAEHGLVRRK